jgi:hypothetical protein
MLFFVTLDVGPHISYGLGLNSISSQLLDGMTS